MYQTTIEVGQLHELTNKNEGVVLFDTRFSLAETEKGLRDYLEAHIPGAIYVHLDRDLSGSIIEGRTGRHPLPAPDAFAKRLGNWGVSNKSQVVVYDDAGGGIAARLWWMLRWLGHDAAAVLNGGWNAWMQANLPTSTAISKTKKKIFVPHIREEMIVNFDQISSRKNEILLVDSRTEDRFAGQNETIDAIAGHIPGAVNFSYTETNDESGHQKSKNDLRAHFSRLYSTPIDKDIVFYCGSGVTACKNILAMAHAGLTNAKLYPGSWSEWINLSDDFAIGEE